MLTICVPRQGHDMHTNKVKTMASAYLFGCLFGFNGAFKHLSSNRDGAYL